ncbi:MAG: hypothetical protein DRI28_05910 [Caldiserica bacterium]|nr:MAG: hypothetical protein DRI28_05910 [Caldisericota bacterium]
MIFQFNWIPAFIFFAISLMDILFTNRGFKKGRIFTKPLIIPSLLLYYSLNSTTLNLFIILALILSTMGDVFLLFRRSKMFLILGLIAFLLAHIFYTVLFLSTVTFSLIPNLFYLIIIPYIVFGVVVFKNLKLKEKSIKVGVFLYILVIISMSFSSLLRFYSVPFMTFILPFSGSILFIISDSMLSMRYFGEKRIRGEFVTVTYVLAQFLIVSGFMY